MGGGKAERLPNLANELVRAKVDLIVTFTTQGVRAVIRATETIPIVFVAGNPVGHGVAASLARLGKNATGVALQAITPDKAAQLLEDAVPTISRVGYLYDPRSTTPDRVKPFEDQDRSVVTQLRVSVRLISFPD